MAHERTEAQSFEERDDRLNQYDAIRGAIEHDTRALRALRKLSELRVNVDAILALLPEYVRETLAARHRKNQAKKRGRRKQTEGAFFEAYTFDPNPPGRLRRIEISAHKLKTLPGRLRQLSDDVLLAGFLRTMPGNLSDTYLRLRALAGWLEENRPMIPDARFPRGPTRVLRLILLYAIPSDHNYGLVKLARYFAEVLAPVGNLFHFDPPSADALKKLITRTFKAGT